MFPLYYTKSSFCDDDKNDNDDDENEDEDDDEDENEDGNYDFFALVVFINIILVTT